MDIITKGLAAGIMGTIFMDILNHLSARTGIIIKIDIRMIGRMFACWLRGNFRYNHPGEMKPVSNELILGYCTHYLIGIVLALLFVFVWDGITGLPVPPYWMLVYGLATTAVSLFYVYPSMGLGVAGINSPEGGRNILSSIANHLFFVAGMAAAVIIF